MFGRGRIFFFFLASQEIGSASEAAGKGNGQLVAIFEGRLLDSKPGRVELEVMHRMRVEILGKDIVIATKVQDKASGRMFARALLNEGTEVHGGDGLVWRPKMGKDIDGSHAVPFGFCRRRRLGWTGSRKETPVLRNGTGSVRQCRWGRRDGSA